MFPKRATTKCISVSDVRCERKFFRVKYHCDRNQQLFKHSAHNFQKSLPVYNWKDAQTSTMQELGLTFSEFPQERILTWLSISALYGRCQRRLFINFVECQQTNLQKVSKLC